MHYREGTSSMKKGAKRTLSIAWHLSVAKDDLTLCMVQHGLKKPVADQMIAKAEKNCEALLHECDAMD